MKRKFFLLFALVFLFTSVSAHAQWTDRLTLYLPNRVMDLLDTFTLNIGGGPTAHAELYCTQACKAGGGISYIFMLMKDHNRQYGWAAQNGFAWYLPGLTQEDIERKPASYFVQEFWHNHAGFPDLHDAIYEPRKGARDYWEIGGSIGAAILDVTVSINPVEIADAVLGFFFLDICHDDMTFETFK